MPSIILYCGEEEAALLSFHGSTIAKALKEATVKALDLAESKFVSFVIVPFAFGEMPTDFLMVCYAEHFFDPHEANLTQWKWTQALAKAWADLEKLPEMDGLMSLEFQGSIGIYPFVPSGYPGWFKRGEPIYSIQD